MRTITTRYPLATALLCGGLVSGTIDIGMACLITLLPPSVILRSIASGLIGEAAFKGAVATALLGLFLQWGMSILIAAIYIAVTALSPGVRARWRSAGVAAGVVIFVVMNYLVVPLSAAPFRTHLDVHSLLTQFTPFRFVANLLAMILFGLIIAFFSRNSTLGSASRRA